MDELYKNEVQMVRALLNAAAAASWVIMSWKRSSNAIKRQRGWERRTKAASRPDMPLGSTSSLVSVLSVTKGGKCNNSPFAQLVAKPATSEVLRMMARQAELAFPEWDNHRQARVFRPQSLADSLQWRATNATE